MEKKDKKINIVFIGTPDFGVPTLKMLINDSNFNILGVITQTDKKVGRKHVLTPSPIKEEAIKNNLKVWQPERIKNFDIPAKNIDFIIVIAYGQIIPKNILELPKYGCINIHGSLLPKYRGAACIQEAIKNGDKKTGVTIMKMDEHLDTGPILTQSEINISPNDTTGTVYEKISKLGAEILIPTLRKYINNEIKPNEQNDSASSYVGLLKKSDGEINWSKTAIEIERFIRAMNPWPGAFAFAQSKTENSKSKKIIIISTKPEIFNFDKFKPGDFFAHNGDLLVQCGKDSLMIDRIQPEGKKVMDAKSFLNGYPDLIIGDNKN